MQYRWDVSPGEHCIFNILLKQGGGWMSGRSLPKEKKQQQSLGRTLAGKLWGSNSLQHRHAGWKIYLWFWEFSFFVFHHTKGAYNDMWENTFNKKIQCISGENYNWWLLNWGFCCCTLPLQTSSCMYERCANVSVCAEQDKWIHEWKFLHIELFNTILIRYNAIEMSILWRRENKTKKEKTSKLTWNWINLEHVIIMRN